MAAPDGLFDDDAAAGGAPAAAAAGGGAAGGTSGIGGAPGALLGGPPANSSPLLHPLPTFLHVVFRALAVLAFLNPFASDTWNFISCVIFLAFDFYFVKNVSGRFMVGLRWWSIVRDDGETEWLFESHQGEYTVHPFEEWLFWGALWAAPVLWILILILQVLKFSAQNVFVCVFALILSGSNLGGYIRCSKEAQSRVQSQAQGFLANTVLRRLF